jgi:hypothetical protein
MSRPPRIHVEPVTEPDEREVLGRAIGKILRLARHAAELNLHGPYDAVEANFNDLRAAIDSAVMRFNSRDGVRQ